MILPASYTITFVLMILSMLCWGSWANTFKMSRNGWRFELYYYDYAIGVLIAALIAAFTFGSLGFDGFSFTDDFLHAGKRQLLFGFTAGVIFNLANMLLVGAISVIGMAIAFPVGIGLALVIGVIWNYLIAPSGNAMFLFTGVAIITAAVILAAFAYRSYAEMKLIERIEAGLAKSTRIKISMKGIILSVVSGLLMGSFFPVLRMGQEAEVGLGPYAITVVFALGVLVSTFVFNLFFTNLPIQGEPVDVVLYFRTDMRNHVLGILGGVVWCLGLVMSLVAATAEGPAKAGAAVSYAMGQGATLISTLWGIFVWHEFEGSDARVKITLGLMIILFLIGLGLVSMAPLMSK